MTVFTYRGKAYDVDALGFLTDYAQWDEDFARGMAASVDIPGGLTDKHWQVIRYVRSEFKTHGSCPIVYSACKATGLSLRDFKALFPTGYQRGACKLAGVTYKDRFTDFFGEAASREIVAGRAAAPPAVPAAKIYGVDALGFLVDPNEWDEEYASNKAFEMKLPDGLTETHWRIIRYLRDTFATRGVVPTVFECCETIGIDIHDLERLFPDGYHRGAVKIAGLRALSQSPR